MKRVTLIGAALAMLVTPAAFADTVHFEAFLDGLQEAPVPNNSPATGHATAILSLNAPGNSQLCVHLEFSGLVAPQTAAHVHAAPPGTAGSVFLPLLNGSPSDTPCTIISDARANDVLAGNSYVNVHSQTFPGGEIRGQLGKVPEPATLALLAFGGLALIRRR